MSCWATRRLYGIARLLTFVEASRPSIRESGLVGDAAGGRRRRDNELPVYDLGANRGRSPSAVCLLAFCAGGLRGAQHQYGDEREEKARADAEPVAAKPHRTRMARGRSRRIGHPAHLQLRQVLSFDDKRPSRSRRLTEASDEVSRFPQNATGSVLFAYAKGATGRSRRQDCQVPGATSR